MYVFMNALLAFCDGQTRGKANLLNSALPRLGCL